MPSAGSASGHTLCKSAQLGWPQWNYSDPNQLQIHPFVLSLHPQQEGGKKKEPTLQSPGSFLQVLTPVIICKSSSTAAPNNQSRSTNQSQAPCTTSKAPLKEGFDDTAGRSPGWHRPLLVLMCLHSLLITSNILLEQPRPTWAFNQAPDTGGSAVPTL